MTPNLDKPAGVVSDGGKCARCGASIHPAANVCWLCFAPVSPSQDRPPQQSPALPPTGSFSLASLMMFVTLAAVILGVFTLWPGIGVPLGVLSLVVWARTAMIVQQRAAKGVEVTSLQKVQLFLSSLATTTGVLVLIFVTGVAALGAACAAIFAPSEPQAVPWLFGSALIACAGVFVLVRILRRLRR